MPAKAPAKPTKKSEAKAPAKPEVKAPAKAPTKPTAPEPKGKAPNPFSAMGKAPAKTSPGKAGGKAADDGGEPVRVPLQKLEKIAGRDTLCQIEIVKDGHVFIARTETDAGSKEYKNTVFEDLLTEMLITLQEQMADH